MSKDPHLQRLLDEINRYIDDMPPKGSSEYLRFTEAVDELVGHRDALDKQPPPSEHDRLGREIDAVLSRHNRENKAYDRVPGSSFSRGDPGNGKD